MGFVMGFEIVEGCPDGSTEFAVFGDAEVHVVEPFHGRKYLFALWKEGKVADEDKLFDDCVERG